MIQDYQNFRKANNYFGVLRFMSNFFQLFKPCFHLYYLTHPWINVVIWFVKFLCEHRCVVILVKNFPQNSGCYLNSVLSEHMCEMMHDYFLFLFFVSRKKYY